ncbi:peptidase M15A [bacterium (Candidatus Blackallbacteria) CG13_big_fil_rev_8_21_14_2_50_49_14]|nr:MAG: peptidase M15A [bacterium (Candidatus Blackallbacteria) CG18_big_fil_WC_8_21_14_2_50_49_26]PIW46627.1 MAG: peptidase M15A [bacterium (Candidatus Blackallbacteria) CG13_big_fil_rev_8_21_14_2_50_49_14]
MPKLSPNFYLSELTVSQTAARQNISNEPGAAHIANLERLCKTALQPLRDKLARPVLITSGYRSPALNRVIGGSTTSAHMDGRAADIHVQGMSSSQLMRYIHAMNLPVDQVIDEFGSWVHVGIAQAGANPRRQYLIARYYSGRVSYDLAKF